MPDVIPFIHRGDELQHGNPAFFDYAGQSVRTIAFLGPSVNPGTSQNAAGTAENVALHVAGIVAFALIGVYVLRASGFKFVVAGSVG